MTFASNVGSSTSHNYFVRLNRGEECSFRARLKPVIRGRLNWRFRFSNSIDSTFASGAETRANDMGGRFEIISASANGVSIDWETRIAEPGCELRSIPTFIAAEDYIEFTWRLRALENDTILPATPDHRTLSYISRDGGEFIREDTVCLPDFFEAERDISVKMTFIGDSITQGCGTNVDAFEQWAARIAYTIDSKIAVHNIGLGYGRGRDAATDGAWLKKAKEADIVNVCFGVNDLYQCECGATLESDLRRIVTALHSADHPIRVILFTIPPFDMTGKEEARRREVNAAILSEGLGADGVFDVGKILARVAPNDNLAIYGGHPNGEGGKKLAEAYLLLHSSTIAAHSPAADSSRPNIR